MYVWDNLCEPLETMFYMFFNFNYMYVWEKLCNL